MTAARTPFRVHAVTASSTIADGNATAAKQLMLDHLNHIESKIRYRTEKPKTELSDLLSASGGPS